MKSSWFYPFFSHFDEIKACSLLYIFLYFSLFRSTKNAQWAARDQIFSTIAMV